MSCNQSGLPKSVFHQNLTLYNRTFQMYIKAAEWYRKEADGPKTQLHNNQLVANRVPHPPPVPASSPYLYEANPRHIPGPENITEFPFDF